MRPDQAQDQVLPTRIVHLPLAFNEKWTHDAIAKYMKSVRKDAPYVPSNVDFVAANNGALMSCRCHALALLPRIICVLSRMSAP